MPDALGQMQIESGTMGLFEPASVKALRKEGDNIGGMLGQAQVGHLAWADVEEVVASQHFRTSLKAAFASAADDVGESRALKAVHKAARIAAGAWPHVSKMPPGNVEEQAILSIDRMLGRR